MRYRLKKKPRTGAAGRALFGVAKTGSNYSLQPLLSCDVSFVSATRPRPVIGGLFLIRRDGWRETNRRGESAIARAPFVRFAAVARRVINRFRVRAEAFSLFGKTSKRRRLSGESVALEPEGGGFYTYVLNLTYICTFCLMSSPHW
ncbi:hypothetical protein EVAR_30465_1 [Eumeta japonica]|uniref:Uncharacterized protein n=1 Tax=Eumeta variegata TaxID=151549 RepID=A0A4C1VWW1_EUMVA|nr:hypothetical protein EVAR_30465_1 [Eumeta japonica]